MFRSMLLMVAVLTVASLAASSYLQRAAQSHQPRPSFEQRASSAPPQTSNAGPEEIAIAPDRSGNYFADVDVGGHLIHMIVDTGATYVSLTSDDAHAIGLYPAPADFRFRTMTANGASVAAKVRIATLRLGQLTVDNVDAFVMPAGVTSTSLLGMSALSRLGSVQISNGELILRQ